MLSYLLTFTLASLFGYLSSLSENSRIKQLFALLSCFCLCTLAACRDMTVGTDTDGYAWNIFRVSQHCGLTDTMRATAVEPLFAVGAHFASVVFRNYSIVLFLINFAAVGPFVAAMRRLAPNRMGLAMASYSFIFYGGTLNIMRQAIVASLFIWMYIFAKERKKFHYCLFLVLALGFHNTALLGLAIWPIVVLVDRPDSVGISSEQAKKILFGCIIAYFCSIFVVFFFSRELLSIAAYFKESYSYQLAHIGEGSVRWSYVFLSIVIIVAAKIIGKESHTALLLIVLLSLPLSFLSVISSQLFRLAFTFAAFVPVLFCQFLNYFEDIQLRRKYGFCLVVAAFAYFFWTYIYGMSMEIYPYTSTILGIG